MSEYSSPLQRNDHNSGGNLGGNEMNESSGGAFYQDDRRGSYHRGSGFNQRRPYFSRPYDRNRGRNFDRPHFSPFNRGPRHKNYQRERDSDDCSYFHPSMLENPWVELEKKFEKSNTNPSNATKTNQPDDSSSSSSDSE